MSGEPDTLTRAVQQVINRLSQEAPSNTPDFILAEFMVACFDAFNRATYERDRWWGLSPAIGTRSDLEDRLLHAAQGPVGDQMAALLIEARMAVMRSREAVRQPSIPGHQPLRGPQA